MISRVASIAAVLLLANPISAQSFVNWESPHLHPLEVTPDGTHVLAVNTTDNRLEVLAAIGPTLTGVGSIAVGLDPVTVRARGNDEAWVVNHVSDSISVVDLATMSVRGTLATGDEPTDVVFAGSPERAFVAVSQLNEVRVFDPSDLTAAPIVLSIEGEDPRALATDGTTVFVAIAEAGNGTTILDEFVVSTEVNPYPGDPNPVPNFGSVFEPPIAGDLPTPPETSLIVQKQGDGIWRDDNDGDWSAAVTWDLHGHALARIDADSLTVSYDDDLMNFNASLDVASTGDVLVVGTQAMNHVRFEPNLNGTFLRVQGAIVSDRATQISDLNPHLDYSTTSVSQGTRDLAIGDPRGVVWNAAGDQAYISGMGSNNVVIVDTALARMGRVEVGEGPTGVALHPDGELLYVLNRFEASISVVDTAGQVESSRTDLYDPTPLAISEGRPFLYDTHRTSGLGHVSCASCHIDGRMDQVSWDLGDPSGSLAVNDENCNFGQGGCEDFHPMKGPMVTQTLLGIIGTEPFHWRGDRHDFSEFNGAFVSLLGDDVELTGPEMTAFEAFVATLTVPPNPFREMTGALPTSFENGGNAAVGAVLFTTAELDGVDCVTCHAMPSGTDGSLTSADLILAAQSMKIPQLRNLHEKTGFDEDSSSNNRGFGFLHDGSTDSLLDFLQFPGFTFNNEQERLDVVAFLMSFSTDTHAGIGTQMTIGGDSIEDTVLRNQMLVVAAGDQAALVAKGTVDGIMRGYAYVGAGMFQSDRVGETAHVTELDAFAADTPITYTLVPFGSQTRIGIDRDEDGFFDRDELDACSDPADPASIPGAVNCAADVTGEGDTPDGVVNVMDLLAVLSNWGGAGVGDVNCSGSVDTEDLLEILGAWGVCP